MKTDKIFDIAFSFMMFGTGFFGIIFGIALAIGLFTGQLWGH